MVHLFNQKVYPRVKNVVPSPTEYPIPVEVQNKSIIESQEMMQNSDPTKIEDEISTKSNYEDKKSEKTINTSTPIITSPSQG